MKTEKTRSLLRFGLVGVIALALVLAMTIGLYPPATARAAAPAPAHADSLVVRYDMGDVDGNMLVASRWDADSNAYVAFPEASAAITGSVVKTLGVEGEGAGIFGKTYAEVEFHMPEEVTGVTFSTWARNWTDDWGGFISVADAEATVAGDTRGQGFRFGKGCVQENAGGVTDWITDVEADRLEGTTRLGRHFFPGLGKMEEGSSWGSFVTTVADDNPDAMAVDTWYHVTLTVTATEMKLYRDGVLKFTFGVDQAGAPIEAQVKVLEEIMAAFYSETGAFAIHASAGNNTAANDEMDDFRIYAKSLTADEVTTLYAEYKEYKDYHTTLKTDDATYGIGATSVTKNKSAYTVQVADGSAPFPKLLLGDATDVTETSGTYAGNGTTEYSYTVSGDTATLTYAGDTLTVTRVYKDVASTLLVRYGLDGVVDGKLKATKYQDGKFVAYPEMDATVSGEIAPVDGQEGGNAINFPLNSYAVPAGKLVLPSGSNGATFSLWAKNLYGDWEGLFDIADGTDGARFGKGCLQSNEGKLGGWAANMWPGLSDKFTNGGAWDSFVYDHENTTAVDRMEADTWYHVTITVTATEMKLYRNGSLKITLDTGKGTDKEDVAATIASLYRALTSGNAQLGIHRGLGGNRDIMDDLRIYGTAMEQADIDALYTEYKAIAGVKNISLKTDDAAYGSVAVAIHTADPYVTINVSSKDTFPKLLLGDTSDVTLESGVYSGEGTGILYSYTVNGDTATLTYTLDGGETRKIYVTRELLAASLATLTVKVDGTATDIGFVSTKKEYTVELSPNNTVVTIEATAAEGTVTLPTTINYNGANVVTVQLDNVTATYTVTLKRDSSAVLKSLKGMSVGATTQTVYVDEIPSAIVDADVELMYPQGATATVMYASPTATVVVTDSCTNAQVTYTVTFARKADGQFAHWTMDGTTAGKKWNSTTHAWEDDAALSFNVYQGKDGSAAVASDSKKKTPTYTDAALGKGLTMPEVYFAAVTLPAAGGISEFTVSAYVNLAKDGAWAPFFSLYDNGYTRGALLEKSMLQFPSFKSGTVTSDYDKNTYHGGNTNCAQGSARWYENDEGDPYDYTVFNGDVYLTITVSYLDGKGVIEYYANGKHVLTYANNEQVDFICEDMIYALNSGAHFGLRRHCFDSQGAAMYDDVRLYKYAMPSQDVAAQYADFMTMRDLTVSAKAVSGKSGYPTLDLGADEATSGSKRVGTLEGVSYEYTPLEGDATKAKDTAGVAVTFTKGVFSRTISVSYTRTFTVEANKLGYSVGGASGQVTIESGVTEYTVRVAAAANLDADDAVTAGTHDAEGCTVSVAYDKASATATYTVQYADYDDNTATYTVKFEHKSTVSALTKVTVTGIKSGDSRELTDADFGTTHTASVAVASKANFTLTLTFVLPAGATVEGATGDTLTLTQADLGGDAVTFTVYSEDGGDNKTVYTLQLSDVSSDAALKALAITGHDLTPSFASSTLSYTVVLQESDDAAALVSAITATVNNSAANCEKTYDQAGDKFVVTVTAEDGTTKRVYEISVQRVSADATLSSIQLGENALQGFDAATVAYELKYNSDIAKEYGTVTVTTTSSAAHATVGALKDGKIEIVVTAENGTKKTYTLTFVKRSAVSTLATVTVDGTTLTLEPGKMTYDYELPAGKDIASLEVVATPTDSAAQVSKRVDEGESKIFITVTAENGSMSNYTISVTAKTEPPTPDNGNKKKGGCGSSASANFLALSLLVLAAGTTLILRRKQKASK